MTPRTKLASVALMKMRQQARDDCSKQCSQVLRVVMVNDDCEYTSPGVRQSAPAFQMALQRLSIYCEGKRFGAMDSMMQATVMKHRLCYLQRLVLHDIRNGGHPSFEEDLAPAIGKCKSLRCVAIVGGEWTPSFVEAICGQAQTDNPRISELYLENIRYVSPVGNNSNNTHDQTLPSAAEKYDVVRQKKTTAIAYSASLVVGVSRLLMDYFNYSVPGIVVLSLHDSSLRSKDIESMAEGIRVNYSLQTLVLSANLIDECGLIVLLNAIVENRKTVMTQLDMSLNLIAMSNELRSAIDRFHISFSQKKTFFDLNLSSNPVFRCYFPPFEIANSLHVKIHGLPQVPLGMERVVSADHPCKRRGASTATAQLGRGSAASALSHAHSSVSSLSSISLKVGSVSGAKSSKPSMPMAGPAAHAMGSHHQHHQGTLLFSKSEYFAAVADR